MLNFHMEILIKKTYNLITFAKQGQKIQSSCLEKSSYHAWKNPGTEAQTWKNPGMIFSKTWKNPGKNLEKITLHTGMVLSPEIYTYDRLSKKIAHPQRKTRFGVRALHYCDLDRQNRTRHTS